MHIIILVACLWLATSPLYGKIVFYSHRDGNAEIYTMASDGSNQTRLTFNEANDVYPIWSPDGRQIAFHSDRDGNDEIYMMDANGKNQRNLTRHPGRDAFPDWHPDGELLVFASDREGGKKNYTNIFVMDTDGSNVQQITDLYAFASRPKWSPDGTRIAFDADFDKAEQGKPRQVYIIDADGSDRWQVSDVGAQSTARLNGWSPDGQQILYTPTTFDRRFDNTLLVVATLSPNEPGWRRQVFGTLGTSKRRPAIGSAFSPDGKSILYIMKEKDHWNIYRDSIQEGIEHQLTNDRYDNFAPHESPHKWTPRLSVSSQRLTPTLLGEIKEIK